MASRMGLFLRGYRAAKSLDAPAMAERIGVSETRLRLIENGQEFPPASERQRIACRLGIGGWMDLDALWRDDAISLPKVAASGMKVAVINKAPAGEPQDYEEYGLHSGVGADYVDAPPGFEGATLFAFIVVGDSMRGAYEPDDLVFCRPVAPKETLPAGSPVFVRLGAMHNHRCTFKLWFPAARVEPVVRAEPVARADAAGRAESVGRAEPVVQAEVSANESVDLRPINPAYPTLRVEKQNIAALGLAVWRTPRHYANGREPHLVQDEYSQM
jgi:transcriptional regulator with XRE-family HTH domain